MDNKARILSTILKHDDKVTSYKIALLRAINDVVLNFPDLNHYGRDVAIPLRVLAQYWIAYYWPFVEPDQPIYQGQRSPKSKTSLELRNDMAFRPQLTALRQEWEQIIISSSSPSDGFFLINELRIARKSKNYPSSLHKVYQAALTAISKTLEMPIRYAGPNNWTVFAKPKLLSDLRDGVATIPGTKQTQKCLVINIELWETFRQMSLWVEALCIHEWCLFTERVQQEDLALADRGLIYRLLTDRPDNRRPLTWERNNVDLLLMEGTEFICPWTKKQIKRGVDYDLDHLLPVSLYPINELWNLAPADPEFNSHQKRDRLPTWDKLQEACPRLELTYKNYTSSTSLRLALHEDVSARFSNISVNDNFPVLLANAVIKLINIVAESRNVARF